MLAEAVTPTLDERIMIGVLMYYTPVLIFLGTIGNCLAVWVLFRKDLRHSSSSFYLAALAISDTGFLMAVLVRWLKIFDVDIFHDRFCQFFVFPTCLWSFLSVYCVVSFTVERFIAVRYPLHRHLMCTVARARVIIIGLACFGVVACSSIFWMVVPAKPFYNMPACSVPKNWKFWAFVFCIANMIITFIVPFTLIVVLNALIVKTLRKQARIRVTLTSSIASCTKEKSSGRPSTSASASETNITNMLLTVSSVFLCLNFPSYAMKAYTFSKNEDMPPHLHLIQRCCDLIWHTSFGINFFLYCASGKNFRQEVLTIIGRKRRRPSGPIV